MFGNDRFYTPGFVLRDNTLPICLLDQGTFTQITIGLTRGGTVFPNFHRCLVISPFHTFLPFLLQVQRWWIDFFLLPLRFCRLNIFCFLENQSIRYRQIICVPRPVHSRGLCQYVLLKAGGMRERLTSLQLISNQSKAVLVELKG